MVGLTAQLGRADKERVKLSRYLTKRYAMKAYGGVDV
jgi:hypothetical protein